jgi:hypothetical protein
MSLLKFEEKTKHALSFYVYLLIDPENGRIFYVGKASANNRAFDHLKPLARESEKAKQISVIRSKGREPEVHILRHGLRNDWTAEEVEAAVIDTLGLENLTNLCRGKRIFRGRISAKDVNRRYGSQPIKVGSLTEPFMKISINKTYSPTLTEQELYDATRQFWHAVGPRTRIPRADGTLSYPVVLAIADSTVIMVYCVKAWFPAGSTMSTRLWGGKDSDKRWEFVGHSLPGHRLVGKRLVMDDGTTGIDADQKGYGYIN